VTNTNSTNSGGYVVRIPQPGFMHEAMAALGKSRFDDMSDNDELAKKALEDGRLQAEWTYVSFDESSLPTPTKVPGVVAYGQSARDKDRTLTYKDKYDHPTWRTVRKGRRPTIFASREAAAEIVAEHLETAKEFGIVPGNLRYAAIVPAAEWESAAQNDPSDRVARRKASIELARAKRRAEDAAADAAAIEAGLRASKPAPSSSDWHKHPEPQIQQRIRSDGSTVFRARVAGRVSPTFETVAEAVLSRDRLNAQLAAGTSA
jgi:hypothetical protein